MARKRASGRLEAVRLLKKNGSETANKEELNFAVGYLNYFGYIGVDLLQSLDAPELHKSVKDFQKTFGLKTDGILGPKTLRAMEGPRCGCPDKIDSKNKGHLHFIQAQELAAKKRNQWNKSGLTYFIQEFLPGKLTKEQQTQIIGLAFKAWDDICGLNITQAKKAADADIVVSTGRGPQHNFDGRGGTLAWAYLPNGTDTQLGMKFDLDETWIAHPKDRGILISNVACHEFGHILGLTHSGKPNALMAPYYNPFVAVPQDDNDIPRIQKLYGPNRNPAPVMQNVRKVGKNLTVELSPGQKLTVLAM
jgi:predicted Zn-dependent protease